MAQCIFSGGAITMNGVFITFEGPDGAGKTTQIKLLTDELERMGRQVLLTREPGGTKIGDQIRSILLSTDNSAMVNRTEILLYAAGRAQHVHERIIPALNQGFIVLCDRFIDASIAYQAFGLGMDESFVRAASLFASDGLVPIRTYMFDLPAEESRRRLTARAAASMTEKLDRIELKPLEYHRLVREGFLHIAAREQDRVILLDAQLSVEALHQAILLDCKRFLGI
jgi:dTMP kinase